MVGNLFMHTYSRQKLKVWLYYFIFYASTNGLLCEKVSWVAKFTIHTLEKDFVIKNWKFDPLINSLEVVV